MLPCCARVHPLLAVQHLHRLATTTIHPPNPLHTAEAGHNWLPLRASLAMLLHWVLRRDWSGALVARIMMAEMCDEPESTNPAMQAVRLAFRRVDFLVPV